MAAIKSQILVDGSGSTNGETIGVISDTHIPTRARKIPSKVLSTFDNVDLIVHAGDLVDISVVETLKRIAPVLAVYGNMDGPEIRQRFPRLNSTRVLDWKIGVMHDPGALFGSKKMREIAKDNSLHVLIYGHTHSPKIKWKEGTLFINPGSPTNPIPPFITRPSVAVITVTRDRITPRIIAI